MADVHKILIDPKADELRDLIRSAVDTANYRCRVGKLQITEPELRSLIADALTEHEGARRFVGEKTDAGSIPRETLATILGVAWWSDVLGTKHVRVSAFRMQRFGEFHTQRFGSLVRLPPPVCLIFPERVCELARADGQMAVIAQCRCGNSGTLESLAWMGDCCGPCHDYRTEHQQEPEDVLGPISIAHAGPLQAVAFSSSGRVIVSASYPLDPSRARGQLSFHARQDGKLIEEYRLDISLADTRFPFASNGRQVVVGMMDVAHLYDAESGKLISPHWGGGAYQFAMSPTADRMAAIHFNGVHVRSMAQNAAWTMPMELDRYRALLAMSPNGERIAVLNLEGLHIFGSDRLERFVPIRTADRDIEAMAFLDDDRLILAHGIPWMPMNVTHRENVGRVRILDLNRGEATTEFPRHESDATAIGIDPSRTIIATGGSDGMIHLCDCSALTLIGKLRWHTSSVRCLEPISKPRLIRNSRLG